MVSLLWPPMFRATVKPWSALHAGTCSETSDIVLV